MILNRRRWTNHYRQCDGNAGFLLLLPVAEQLPKDHLARFVIDIVDLLDLSAITRQCCGSIKTTCRSSMLLALLIHSYTAAIYSSRRFERPSYDSLIATGNKSHHAPWQEPFRASPPVAELNDAVADETSSEAPPNQARDLWVTKTDRGVGVRQCLFRGLEAVNGEWTLVSKVWNIRRVAVSRR